MTENPQYYDTDEESPLIEDGMLPENSSEEAGLTVEEQNLQTTLEPYLLLEQGGF